ncbi:uncharacterized protein [Scyliorhinus torazame]|uniref:uncharacterized protein isoform X1 n=1 Tax=Scyliorhinus torazame TaxID=75743 RepID=UPI003B5A8FCF
MELRITPECLRIGPQAANATSAFKHWLACFEGYLRTAPGRPTEDQKMQVLHSRVSPEIYSLIEEAEEFPAASNLLKEIYIRPVNQVYARYQLATRRQILGESLDQFFNALTILGRNCNCPAVTANEHTDLLIRDAYVAGLASSQIRQRLFEKDFLRLTEESD